MRGEPKDNDLKAEPIAEDAVSVEKQQEMLLMNKLASGGRLPPKTQSNFLQKKLQQRKFFDSGDYAMNQDKEKKHQRQLFGNKTQVEGSLPTINPATPTAKIAQPAPDEEVATTVAPVSPEKLDSDDDGQLQIPRPETVPQRKASILHPSVHSKLSPQPHLHHEHNDELSS
ncbi:hypothetical protein M3Y94_00514100 [Aphelenchoides besseyi]|nr:hypothetical protein M3Y94_00514100 [Aphelenchoides besseyi]KAI6226026.1 hypothetical protein M3Y95_00758700 [Aphelenchoides besseyi]